METSHGGLFYLTCSNNQPARRLHLAQSLLELLSLAFLQVQILALPVMASAFIAVHYHQLAAS